MRFHDGRHTAITTLAEKGLADWVIQAQVGHVAPAMMKTYSHIRRQALNEAAGALEPSTKATPPPSPTPAATRRAAPVPRVTSQATSQSARRTGRVLRLAKENGSSGSIRTYNPPEYRCLASLVLRVCSSDPDPLLSGVREGIVH